MSGRGWGWEIGGGEEVEDRAELGIGGEVEFGK